MPAAESVWLVRYRVYGHDVAVVPVVSKDDGIAYLAERISDVEWSSYYTSLTKTEEGVGGLSPVRTANDPIDILQVYFGVFCNEPDRFVLEDGTGEVSLVRLWRAGDERPVVS